MKTRYSTWLLIAMLGLTICGCDDSTVASGTKTAGPMAEKNGGPPEEQPSRSDSRRADSGDILSVLSVEHQIDVSAQKDGIVLTVAKDEGSTVKAGEILGQMDDRVLQMELIKAKDDLQVSQNNVKFKEAELKAKGAAYRRQQQLRDYGLSSEADLEAAEFQAKGAEYDLHGWEALVESDQAEIHRIEVEIDQTRLRAPFSGVVVRRYIREGEAIAKADRCFRVSQLAPLQVQFQIPESSARRPQVGARVDLSLAGDSSRALAARVVKVSPTVDPSSDSYDVIAQLTGNALSDLRPGMAVRVNWPAPAATPKP